MHSHTTGESYRTRMPMSEEDELDALAERLRVSRGYLERAVKAIGNSVPAVERYLERYLYEGCA